MTIEVLTRVGSLMGANCYAVVDSETKKCLIIDPGADVCEAFREFKSLGFDPKAILFTHGHFDHAVGGYKAKEIGLETYIGAKDAPMLSNDDNLAVRFGVKEPYYQADRLLFEGEADVCGFKVRVIETPGHTAGSACYLIGDALFTGDTLFKDDIGNYTFPTGNFGDLIKSIKGKLFSLDGNYVVYPGHGEKTNLDRERIYNCVNDY